MYRKKYKLDFGYNLTDIKKDSITGSVKKEDILDYVKRVVERIFEVADNEDISVGKVMFEDEDIAEILGMEDKKIRDGIINLLNTAIVVAKLKEMMNDKKDAKAIDFGVKREKIFEIIKEKIKEQKLESWLNITETEEEFSDKKNPAEIEAAEEQTQK